MRLSLKGFFGELILLVNLLICSSPKNKSFFWNLLSGWRVIVRCVAQQEHLLVGEAVCGGEEVPGVEEGPRTVVDS